MTLKESIMEIENNEEVKKINTKAILSLNSLAIASASYSPETNEEFEKLAKLLDTDIEEIKKEIPPSTKNENCTFNDNSIGINYVNIPQDLLDTVLKYNRKLEEEVLHLKQQISK